MQFRWDDLANIDQPGTYRLSNSERIKIDAKHIVMWMQDPEGVFDAYLHPGDKRRPAEYMLTDFHPSRARAGHHAGPVARPATRSTGSRSGLVQSASQSPRWIHEA